MIFMFYLNTYVHSVQLSQTAASLSKFNGKVKAIRQPFPAWNNKGSTRFAASSERLVSNDTIGDGPILYSKS